MIATRTRTMVVVVVYGWREAQWAAGGGVLYHERELVVLVGIRGVLGFVSGMLVLVAGLVVGTPVLGDGVRFVEGVHSA